MALTEAELGKLVAKAVREIVANPKLETPRKEGPAATLQRFEELLTVKVEQELTQRQEVDLIVEAYQPEAEGLLEKAATEAGLAFQNFPEQLWVKVTRDAVEVRKGYKEEMKLLYSRRAYWQQRLLEVEGDIRNFQARAEENPFWWGGTVKIKEIKERNEHFGVLRARQKKIKLALATAKD
jgi:hypothetical protein